jgi:DNA (cytosine-5)-methyltransferase 1
MRVGSVCSGIEAASVAFHQLGWKFSFYSEIEDFPRAVLAHRYPDVPLHGDFTTIKQGDYADIDVLIGGTPCQDFSLAGLRAGLDGDRGNLSLEFIKLLGRLRPKYFIWENVPGVLSSNDRQDFANILGGFTGKCITPPRGGWKNSGVIQGIDAAYSVSWCVLDAQYFGVAQRRRRVFVVGCLGADWRRACAILLERHSLQGHPAPSREAGKESAKCFDTSIGIDGGVSVAPTLDCSFADKWGLDDQHINGGAGLFTNVPPIVVKTSDTGSNGSNFSEDGVSYTIDTTNGQAVVQPICGGFKGGAGAEAGSIGWGEEISPTLASADSGSNRTPCVLQPVAFNGQSSHLQPMSVDEVSPALDTSKIVNVLQPVAFTQNQRDEVRDLENVAGCLAAEPGMKQQTYLAYEPKNFQTRQSIAQIPEADVARTLKARHDGSPDGEKGFDMIAVNSSVRRLTVRECARLQGFPDNHTELPRIKQARKKPFMSEKKLAALSEQAFLVGRTLDQELEILARRQRLTVAEYIMYGEQPDGPQYKAYGNSMATPVILYLGRRIQMLEDFDNSAAAGK